MGRKNTKSGKSHLYVLPGAASGAGSAMAAPLSRTVEPKILPTAMAAPQPPAVGLEAAKKAARAKTREQAQRPNPAPQLNETKPDRIEEIDMTDKKQNFEKLAAEAATHQQDQLDAVIKSGTALLAGSQDILRTCADLAQQSVEKNSEAMRTLLGCKTLNELTETQTRLAQESFEGLISNATKLSELSVKIATESFEPLNAQLNKAVKKASEAAAA